MPELPQHHPALSQTPQLDKFQSIIGIDYGHSRIGIAVGQMITQTATPVETLHHQDIISSCEAITRLSKSWKADALVIGYPLLADGSETEMSADIKKFCKTLQKVCDLPLFFQNEYTSSQEASTILREQRASGLKNKKTRKGDIDKMAAAIILERWMNEH